MTTMCRSCLDISIQVTWSRCKHCNISERKGEFFFDIHHICCRMTVGPLVLPLGDTTIETRMEIRETDEKLKWEHEPARRVFHAISSSPKLLRVFL